MKKTLIALSLATGLFVGNAIAESTSPLSASYTVDAAVRDSEASAVIATTKTYGAYVYAFNKKTDATAFKAWLGELDAKIFSFQAQSAMYWSYSVAWAKVTVGSEKSVSAKELLKLVREKGVTAIYFKNKDQATRFATDAGLSAPYYIQRTRIKDLDVYRVMA
jgi:hypothetical protein